MCGRWLQGVPIVLLTSEVIGNTEIAESGFGQAAQHG